MRSLLARLAGKRFGAGEGRANQSVEEFAGFLRKNSRGALRDLVFEDAAALVPGEHAEIVEAGKAAPGAGGVVARELLPGGKVGDVVERGVIDRVRAVLVAQPAGEPGEVKQRVAYGGQLPVDQRGQPGGSVEGEQRVGRADVTVDDARAEVVWNVGAQPVASVSEALGLAAFITIKRRVRL